MTHVAEWYFELSGQRRGAFSGVDPIGWSEIADWSALTGANVQPEEVRMLIAMDVAFRDQVREEQKESREGKTSDKAPTPKPAKRKPRKH